MLLVTDARTHARTHTHRYTYTYTRTHTHISPAAQWCLWHPSARGATRIYLRVQDGELCALGPWWGSARRDSTSAVLDPHICVTKTVFRCVHMQTYIWHTCMTTPFLTSRNSCTYAWIRLHRKMCTTHTYNHTVLTPGPCPYTWAADSYIQTYKLACMHDHAFPHPCALSL